EVRIAFVQDVTLGFLNVHLGDIQLELTSAPIQQYAVYFGRSETLGGGELLGKTTNNSFPLPALELNKTYFWQIAAEGQQTVTRGPIWRFGVPPIGPVAHFAWGPEETQLFAGVPFSA